MDGWWPQHCPSPWPWPCTNEVYLLGWAFRVVCILEYSPSRNKTILHVKRSRFNQVENKDMSPALVQPPPSPAQHKHQNSPRPSRNESRQSGVSSTTRGRRSPTDDPPRTIGHTPKPARQESNRQGMTHHYAVLPLEASQAVPGDPNIHPALRRGMACEIKKKPQKEDASPWRVKHSCKKHRRDVIVQLEKNTQDPHTDNHPPEGRAQAKTDEHLFSGNQHRRVTTARHHSVETHRLEALNILTGVVSPPQQDSPSTTSQTSLPASQINSNSQTEKAYKSQQDSQGVGEASIASTSSNTPVSDYLRATQNFPIGRMIDGIMASPNLTSRAKVDLLTNLHSTLSSLATKISDKQKLAHYINATARATAVQKLTVEVENPAPGAEVSLHKLKSQGALSEYLAARWRGSDDIAGWDDYIKLDKGETSTFKVNEGGNGGFATGTEGLEEEKSKLCVAVKSLSITRSPESKAVNVYCKYGELDYENRSARDTVVTAPSSGKPKERRERFGDVEEFLEKWEGF